MKTSLARLCRLLPALVLCWAPGAMAGHVITAVTEELPPYNMTVDGELTGMGTEVVKAVLEEAARTCASVPCPGPVPMTSP